MATIPVCAQEVPGTRKIAFIADTQAPMWIEDLLLESDSNTKATHLLMEDLVARRPSMACFLGDVVNLAFKEKRWQLMDSALVRLRNSGCSVHACLGNHELMSRPGEGEKNFQRRFPDHVNTGYVVVSDSVAVVFLNSNFSKMTPEQVGRQQAWYAHELQELDTTSGVVAVIVACHHPPFSDSKRVGSSKAVQENFVPGFLRSAKARMFVTGHAHLFQHLVYGGKDFVIIGGGGGLRHPMKKNTSGFTDLSGVYKPMFHYLTVTRQPGKLLVESYRLADDFSNVSKGYEFEIPLQKK